VRIRSQRPIRRGAVLAEAAIVIGVFLILVFGTIDVGIAVFRHTVISQAARHGARQAMVHGEYATGLGVWGPTTVNVAATASDPVADSIRPMLAGCDLSGTNITVEWPDTTAPRNGFKKPVRVTITTNFNPIMTFIFGNPSFTLAASSTMPIAH
jgi:Flp pilus assembly protein TadG